MNRTWPMVLLTCLGVPGFLVFSLINSLTSPLGFLTGIPFALLYLVGGVLLFRAGPLWPRGGALYLSSCLLWGAVVAVGLSSTVSIFWFELTAKLGWEAVTASFGGALPEELLKASGVFFIAYAFRRINRPWHGFVTGGLIGLGFEVAENLLYGAAGASLDANSDFSGAVYMWGVRSIAGPGLHILLTAMAGWGIGQAVFCRGRWHSAVLWLLFSTAIHFGWNVSSSSEVEQAIRLGVLMVLLYGTFIVVYRRAVLAQRADDSYVLLS